MSGNRGKGRPKGSPNKSTAEIKALAQAHGADAIARLVKLAGLYPANGEALPAESTQVAAIKELLDRGYGKPTQPVAGDDEMPAIRATLKVSFVGPTGDD